MTNLKKFGREFWSNDEGSTAIEYGLIASLIAVAIIASLQGFAGSSNSMWNVVTNTITDAM